jgi:hypothetical protein
MLVPIPSPTALRSPLSPKGAREEEFFGLENFTEDEILMHRKRILSVLIIATAAGFLAACSSNEKRLAEPGPLVSGVQTEIVHLESAPQLYQAVGVVRSASTAILAAQLAGT